MLEKPYNFILGKRRSYSEIGAVFGIVPSLQQLGHMAGPHTEWCHSDWASQVSVQLGPVVGLKIKFCTPDQIGKTKISGSVIPGSFKIFHNLFESLGFIHILISCLKKNQQLNQTI